MHVCEFVCIYAFIGVCVRVCVGGVCICEQDICMSLYIERTDIDFGNLPFLLR